MSLLVAFDELKHILKSLRAAKRIVLCHGVFDLLHIGHIRYLKRAKELGDILVVTLTPDQWVDKGPHRPAFNSQLRCEAIASLDCVDYVALNLWPTAENTLRSLRPHIYAKGAEFKNLEDPTGKIALEETVCRDLGIEVKFIEELVFSSSNLINRYLSSFSQECQEYLHQFRMRYDTKALVSRMDLFRDMCVVVAGDVIIDEYTYCSPLGASSKDPVLALRHQADECFAGGAVAVCNHIASFVKEVRLCSSVGDDGAEDFINTCLAPNVRPFFIRKKNRLTVKKHRILDSNSFQKHLELYYMDPEEYTPEYENELLDSIRQNISSADILIAADFGNGCISNNMARELSRLPIFLAVNTQSNAGNRGHHTISKYSRADFVSLATHEVLLEFRNQSLSIIDMLIALREKMRSRYMLLTEGRDGCAVLGEDDFQRAPSFSTSIVDRVGAGDALFSITSLAAKCGFPSDVMAFFGNIAGSLAIRNIGNAKALNREAICRYIQSVMK